MTSKKSKISKKYKNKNKRINYETIVYKLHNLFCALGLSNNSAECRLALSIVAKLHIWVTCEGRPGLDRFKALSNACVRAIMGLRLDQELPYKYPRVFLRAVVLSRKSHLDRLFWISVFHAYRLVTMTPEYKVSTITDRFGGSLISFVRNFWTKLVSTCNVFKRTYNIRPPAPFEMKWSISGSAGPNGSPAYCKWIEDTYAVLRTSLSIKIFCLYWTLPVINREHVENSITDTISWVWEHSSEIASQYPKHSRLAFLSDKGGKTRVVGIVDILSQSLLKPVHGHLSNILRIIPQDGTFDQDFQRVRVKSWSMVDDHLSSIDLSACTDRFPGLLQALLLWKCNALTLWQAFWWLQVIARRTFVYKHEGTLKRIRYKVGQPMGALSSWPAMALCHHVLVQLSYKAAYPESSNVFEEYALLGDDLVIRDRRVAESYKELIGVLGMPFSPSKSFEAVGVAEFAKSLFRHGEDLKPFPLALLQYRKNTMCTDAQALLKELSFRGYSIDISDLLRLYPKRWRLLITSAVLLPSSVKACLAQPFQRLRSEQYNTFESLVLAKRIRSFSDPNKIFETTHAFVANDPTKRSVWGNPFIQIGHDNSGNYPVRHLGSSADNTSPYVLVGLGWFAYDPECWPEGLPSLKDRKLVPGPSWKIGHDDVILRQSFQEIERLLPGWFWPWCNNRAIATGVTAQGTYNRG